MFTGSIESHSHEGGLLASFTGSSPALGSIIVSSDDGTYIGKIDAVLGGTESPIAHIAHLDRKMDASQFIGIDVKIRPKAEREDRFDRSRGERNDRRRNDDRGGRRDDRRDSRRDNRRDFARDNRRGNDRDNRSRGYDRRDSHGDNDWDCPKCNNSNFARRVECNRCGAPKPGGGHSGDRRNSRHDSRPPRRDNRRDSRDRNYNRTERKTFTDNDWECKKCNNINFSFRTECNRCGESKPGGGGNNRDRGPQRDNRQRRDRGARRERGPRRDDRPSRGGRGSDRDGGQRRDDRQGRERGARRERDPNSPKFRRARGKSSGHAHNRGPQPLNTRPLRRNRDD